MKEQHHDLSPSSFPAWAECPCFDSDSIDRKDATEGTRQHQALSNTISGSDDPLEGLSQDGRDAVTWAADYIKILASERRVASEIRVRYSVPDAFARRGTSVIFYGTADVVIIRGNLADLIDYKSGADDFEHRQQLAGYALALFSMRRRLKTIRCHILYGRVRRADTFSFTQADAAGVVLPILEARQDPNRSPRSCAFCMLCKHRPTCQALTNQVTTVATANEWDDLAPALRNPGAITDPAILGKALTLSRFVGTWADAVRKAATGLAKDGTTIPGYRLQERRGQREVNDVGTAFDRSGLTPAQFVTACKLSIPKLSASYATARGISKAQASRDLEAMLGDLVQEGRPTVSLVVDRGPK